MLKKRIIPIVLLDGFSVVKTIEFDVRRNIGSPITVLRTYNTRNVDELILLDIDAARNNRAIDIFTVRDIASECFMPLTVGGGIKNVSDIEEILKAGADKVCINSIAISNISRIEEASRIFGKQCIVVSVDVVKKNSKYKIFSRDKVIERDLITYVKELEQCGAGELMITSVDLDGSLVGGDSELAELVSSNVSIPVIYSGGINSVEDCATIGKTNVAALGIASLFLFTNITPRDCKISMDKENISVRLK
jgi:imidazole glycerol-phosphate synthase subunit HisF